MVSKIKINNLNIYIFINIIIIKFTQTCIIAQTVTAGNVKLKGNLYLYKVYLTKSLSYFLLIKKSKVTQSL